MEIDQFAAITIETIVYAPVEKGWEYWTEPEHVIKWYFATDDWHAPNADNDLRVKKYSELSK